MVIGEALRASAGRIPGDTPRLEAEVLLAHVLDRSRGWLLAHPETHLAPGEQAEFERGQARLAEGEPLAYLTGRREFFGLDFLVNQHVLVPRPETELLVEHALAACSVEREGWRAERVADVGTGSGCIAVALAVHVPGVEIVATDISAEALAVARRNAERHGVLERIDFRQGDLLQPLAEPVDLLCANLPYVDTDELAGLEVARHEPRLALDGGRGGLTCIERLLADAPRCVNPGGLILLEIGATQGEAAAALARAAFPEAKIKIHNDLASLPRLLIISIQE